LTQATSAADRGPIRPSEDGSRAALQLRYLQTLTDLGVSQNATVVFPLPLEILRGFGACAPLGDDGAARPTARASDG
jgi:hypothetical protein